MKTAEQLIEELGIQDLDTFMMSEDFDQLDELSKATLGSYIKKANKQSNTASEYKGEIEGRGENGWDYEENDALVQKRQKGISKATDKLTKESIEAMVSAVLDGDQESASDAFSQAIGEMISDRMDAIKQDIASGL